ncbi:MAG: tRNA CCA-pyrophosphorylase [Candidatus Hydrothermarchaeota archaeon]|nr:MAG: tRNA CCA-pyrophosphorylase [Candidatus Hydrothermarchaeota archaeon]
MNPIEIHKLLPKKNCGECGVATCMAFAIKLLSKKASLEECKHIKKAEYIRNYVMLKEMLAPLLKAKETRLIINEKLCNGCGNCVVVCPSNVSISLSIAGGKGPENKNVVFRVSNGLLLTENLILCKRFEEEENAQPCTACINACPIEAIEFA